MRNRRRGPFSRVGANRPLKSHSNTALEVGSSFKRVASYKSRLRSALMPCRLFNLFHFMLKLLLYVKSDSPIKLEDTPSLCLAKIIPLPITKSIKSNQIRSSLIPIPLMPRNNRYQTIKRKVIKYHPFKTCSKAEKKRVGFSLESN